MDTRFSEIKNKSSEFREDNMNLNISMKKLILNLNLSRLVCGDWRIEISMPDPSCVYYFEPFLDFEEASEMCLGCVQDLISEGAKLIHTAIKRCHPTELSKFDEAEA